MNNKQKMILTIAGAGLAPAGKISAQIVGGSPKISIDNPLGTTSFIQIINNILNYFIYISVPILALMILIGGFQILFARGDPSQIATGRKTITYAVVGALVILVSKGIGLILLQIIG